MKWIIVPYTLCAFILPRQERDQKFKLSYCDFDEIISGLRQGSILGPPSFNIYMSIFFYEKEGLDIANYADDSKLFAFSSKLYELLLTLNAIVLVNAIKCFNDSKITSSNPILVNVNQ